MYKDLKNKIVIITGGAGYIGQATVRAFLKNGAKVVIVDVDVEKGEQFLKKLPRNRVIFLPVDVSDESQVDQMVKGAIEKFGRIDILVNVAGGSFGENITDTDFSTFQKNIADNLTSVWLCTKAVIPHLQEGGGAIVNISSVNALLGIPGAAYSAAKAGVDSLARTTGVRFGKYGIRCNSLVLGTIATGTRAWAEKLKEDHNVFKKIATRIPRKKVGTPEEAASLILFLSSEESRLINGSAIVADGGWTVSCGLTKANDGLWWED